MFLQALRQLFGPQRSKKQTTFCYCPTCDNELVGDPNSPFCDTGLVRYTCSRCGSRSTWDFGAPVPLLIRHPVSATTIAVKDFSKFPAGRFRTDGMYSGQRFREEYLIPALTRFDQVIVCLDGTLGYASSFLQEAFGGLLSQFTSDELRKKLDLRSRDKSLVREICGYISA